MSFLIYDAVWTCVVAVTWADNVYQHDDYQSTQDTEYAYESGLSRWLSFVPFGYFYDIWWNFTNKTYKKIKNRKLRIKNSTFPPVRTNTELNYIYKFNSYRAVNTFGLSYKKQWVNVIWKTNHTLGAFVKSIKATITSFTSVRLSTLNHSGPIGPIFWNFISEYFSKVCRENLSFIQICQKWQVPHMKTSVHFWTYLAQFLE